MAGKRGARAPRLLRRARQHRGRLTAFRDQVTRHWFKALRRRSQRHRLELGADEPPRPPVAPARPHRCIPTRRCASRSHLRQEPSAVVPHAGICAGGGRNRTRPTKGGPYRNPERAVPTAINVEAEGSSLFTSTKDPGHRPKMGSPNTRGFVEVTVRDLFGHMTRGCHRPTRHEFWKNLFVLCRSEVPPFVITDDAPVSLCGPTRRSSP